VRAVFASQTSDQSPTHVIGVPPALKRRPG
jgi:hypothetical protein